MDALTLLNVPLDPRIFICTFRNVFVLGRSMGCDRGAHFLPPRVFTQCTPVVPRRRNGLTQRYTHTTAEAVCLQICGCENKSPFDMESSFSLSKIPLRWRTEDFGAKQARSLQPVLQQLSSPSRSGSPASRRSLEKGNWAVQFRSRGVPVYGVWIWPRSPPSKLGLSSP